MSTQIIESRPAGYSKEQVGDPRRLFALPVLLTGACLPILGFNVVNLALPAIRGDLGSTSSEVQFVISADAATYAVFLIAGGRLGDLFGRRRMFLWGVAGFTIASLLCGVASSPGGPGRRANPSRVCGDDVGPQVLASIRALFPPDEQGRALAFYGVIGSAVTLTVAT